MVSRVADGLHWVVDIREKSSSCSTRSIPGSLASRADRGAYQVSLPVGPRLGEAKRLAIGKLPKRD